MTLTDDVRHLIFFFAKKRAAGFPHIDHRDIAQEACLAALRRTKPIKDGCLSMYIKCIVGNVFREKYTDKTKSRKEMLDYAVSIDEIKDL